VKTRLRKKPQLALDIPLGRFPTGKGIAQRTANAAPILQNDPTLALLRNRKLAHRAAKHALLHFRFFLSGRSVDFQFDYEYVVEEQRLTNARWPAVQYTITP